MKRTLSLMLAALLLAGCAGPAAGTGEGEAVKANEASGTGGASSPRPALRTLAEPVYPEFPQQPVMPREGGAEEWEAYREAREKYTDALAAVRGENSGLSTEGVSSLNAFAARSTRLILEGHEGENAICSPCLCGPLWRFWPSVPEGTAAGRCWRPWGRTAWNSSRRPCPTSGRRCTRTTARAP